MNVNLIIIGSRVFWILYNIKNIEVLIYFYICRYNVFEMIDGIDNFGDLNFKLVVCLFVVWVLVYFCIWKGIWIIGKVVYVIVMLFYVFLVIFFIWVIMLLGFIDGIMYYVILVWMRFVDLKVIVIFVIIVVLFFGV